MNKQETLNPTTQSQCDLILNHMIGKGAITPIDALQRYGCFRLAARIHDLRKAGWEIITVKVKRCGNTFAAYKLDNEKAA